MVKRTEKNVSELAEKVKKMQSEFDLLEEKHSVLIVCF